MEDGVLAIGIVNPDNIGARDAIQFIASKLNIPFKLYLISYTDFTSLISQYKGLSGEVSGALSNWKPSWCNNPTKQQPVESWKRLSLIFQKHRS